MGFDGSSAMIQDANLDDSLYKNTDGASCFLMDGGTGFQADGTRVDDQPMAVDFDGGPPTHQEDGFASGGDDYGMQKPPVLAFVSFFVTWRGKYARIIGVPDLSNVETAC